MRNAVRSARKNACSTVLRPRSPSSVRLSFSLRTMVWRRDIISTTPCPMGRDAAAQPLTSHSARLAVRAKREACESEALRTPGARKGRTWLSPLPWLPD
jgi:hypothetical protein